MVKIKRFQELLTQLLQQHSALSHVLPALKDVVSNAIDFTYVLTLVCECECISACKLTPPPPPPPLERLANRQRFGTLPERGKYVLEEVKPRMSHSFYSRPIFNRVLVMQVQSHGIT